MTFSFGKCDTNDSNGKQNENLYYSNIENLICHRGWQESTSNIIFFSVQINQLFKPHLLVYLFLQSDTEFHFFLLNSFNNNNFFEAIVYLLS